MDRIKTAGDQVQEWNRDNPPGTLVDVDRISGERFRSVTSSKAVLTKVGTPVVKVAELGWYILNRIKPVERKNI